MAINKLAKATLAKDKDNMTVLTSGHKELPSFAFCAITEEANPDEPWKEYPRNQIEAEHWEEDSPASKYFKDLFNRHTGEVALAWEEWARSTEDLPLDVAYWHEQLAPSERQRYQELGGVGHWRLDGRRYATGSEYK